MCCVTQVNFSTSDFSPTKSLASALTIMSMEEDDGLFSRDVGLNSVNMIPFHFTFYSI